MPTHELILGGAKSGKSRRAEHLAAAWLAADARHRATLVATAWPGDEEMAARIARHQADRAARVPGLATVELGNDNLAATLQRLAAPRHLLLVDCLTLWLTQCLMPPPAADGRPAKVQAWPPQRDALLQALADSASPTVLVSNEIGLGVMPMSREARAAVDALGSLHQAVAERCARVTLMVAGCALHVKNA